VATNRGVREALLSKLGVSKQRLSQLVKARKALHPMSTEQAVYTIAHDHGIDLSKHLSSEELADAQRVSRDLASVNGAGTATPVAASASKRRTRPRQVGVSVAIDDEVRLLGLSAACAREAKAMAERVYPRLYLFENSVRDVIERVLRDKYGDTWWKDRVPKKVQEAAATHKQSEAKDPWHGKRGARDIDYTFLPQLWDIIKHNWPDFKPFFPNQAWIEGLITNDMNVSRRVVAHMNPLEEDDVKNVEAAYKKWAKQREAIEDLLPWPCSARVGG